MNAHEVLGVGRGASANEIRHAYRVLASKWHPDKQGGDAEIFVAVCKAYHLLVEPPGWTPEYYDGVWGGMSKVAPKGKEVLGTTRSDYCLGLGESANARCPKCNGKGVV